MVLLPIRVALAAILTLACVSVVQSDSHHHQHDHKDLHSEYNFKSVLYDKEDGVFTLHWSFDLRKETIHFAVNVSTNGWVGFGLSPNGGMVHSDVVVGWITSDEEGKQKAHFHDRYAEAEAVPTIDESQDWILEGGEEVPGWTILEFSRKWVTCDERDRSIEADTARVIFSWHDDDPVDDMTFSQHQIRGTASLNLIGGLQNPPADPPNLKNFTVGVTDVLIPHDTDTTYWCHKVKLPDSVIQNTGYVTKYATSVPPESEPYVHHMLIYLCPVSDDDREVEGGNCEAEVEGESTLISNETEKCRGGILIAAWAIGGEDFVYPEDVAYPIGGPGKSRYLLIELHYDNPGLVPAVRDSSGIIFFYTTERRRHDAAILTLGHDIKPYMLIPPSADKYNITAECSTNCTRKFFPEEGITVFANFLHTHLVGEAVELRHFRHNESCGGYEELVPIENNPTYDFDYQQTNFLPKEITVLPGDILELKCTYTTVQSRYRPNSGRNKVTVGGFATKQEMCLSFLSYYPATHMGLCGSIPFNWEGHFAEIADNHGNSMEQKDKIKALNPTSKASDYESAFQGLDWTQEAIDTLQQSIANKRHVKFCYDSVEEMKSGTVAEPVVPECFYQSGRCTLSADATSDTGSFSLIHLFIFSYVVYNFLAFITY